MVSSEEMCGGLRFDVETFRATRLLLTEGEGPGTGERNAFGASAPDDYDVRITSS